MLKKTTGGQLFIMRACEYRGSMTVEMVIQKSNEFNIDLHANNKMARQVFIWHVKETQRNLKILSRSSIFIKIKMARQVSISTIKLMLAMEIVQRWTKDNSGRRGFQQHSFQNCARILDTLWDSFLSFKQSVGI